MPLSAASRLVQIQVKVKRAHHHLKEFDTLAESFRGKYSSIAVGQLDFKGTVGPAFAGLPDIRTYPIASFELLAVAGDIIQNLRSSLDHLVYHLVEVGTRQTPGDNTGFPIVRDPKDYESAKARKVKGARPEAIKAIDTLKPYKGGNDALWRLHDLSNMDKHRFIVTVEENHLLLGEGFAGFYWLKTNNPLFPGIAHPDVNQDIDFLEEETLSKSKIGEGQPLLPFLHQNFEFVDNLILSFEPFLE
jgi:hypothetical protein